VLPVVVVASLDNVTVVPSIMGGDGDMVMPMLGGRAPQPKETTRGRKSTKPVISLTNVPR
jgi:hypothetical protein